MTYAQIEKLRLDELDNVRLAAHERAMRDDVNYRRWWVDRIETERRRRLGGELLDSVTAERQAVRARQRPRARIRRMWPIENLPMPRAFMCGPRWRSRFGVTEVPIAQVNPVAAQYHRPGRKLLMFSLEEDVRERCCVELRPNVYAEWADPREVW